MPLQKPKPTTYRVEKAQNCVWYVASRMRDSPVNPPVAIKLQNMQSYSNDIIDLQLGIQHLSQLGTERNDACINNEESREDHLGLLDLHLIIGSSVRSNVPRDVLRPQQLKQ